MMAAPFDTRRSDGRFAEQNRPCPVDFEARFVRLGRLDCEDHYHVPRPTIDRWLRHCGKARLLEARRQFVEARDQQQREGKAKLTLTEMGRILSRSFPVEDQRIISDELAAAAAHHLRIRCNGGFYVSPTGAGDWWVGLRRRSSAELLDMAKERGFRPASLTGGER